MRLGVRERTKFRPENPHCLITGVGGHGAWAATAVMDHWRLIDEADRTTFLTDAAAAFDAGTFPRLKRRGGVHAVSLVPWEALLAHRAGSRIGHAYLAATHAGPRCACCWPQAKSCSAHHGHGALGE